jgi:hypothetical protein
VKLWLPTTSAAAILRCASAAGPPSIQPKP